MTGLCLALGGCQSDDTTGGTVPSTIEAAEVRTDREPIANRFPQLGGFVEAHWVGGRLGDERVPGPSTYFIEAVVMLAPADVDRLTGRYDFTPAPAAPQPPRSLTPFLPDRPAWSTSPELDRTIGPADWGSRVYLQPDSAVAYVSARGE